MMSGGFQGYTHACGVFEACCNSRGHAGSSWLRLTNLCTLPLARALVVWPRRVDALQQRPQHSTL
jgi:hypothetical protein